MKQGISIQELATEVQRVKEAKRDFVGSTTYLEARPKLEIVTGGPVASLEPRREITNGALDIHIKDTGTFGVKGVAHGQLANKISIPGKYYNRMLAEAPSLLAHNINHWFKHEPEPRMVRTLDGQVRAFLSNAYRPIENHDLVEAILPAILEAVGPNDLKFESTALTDQRMYLKAFIPSMEVPIKTARLNEVVRVGFIVGNSEVGCGSIYAMPMVMVLSCLNGMQMNRYANRMRHVGRRIDASDGVRELYSAEALAADDRALILKTRDVALAALDEVKVQRIVATITDAAESDEISGDVPTAVEEVGDRLGGLTQDEQSGILSYLASGGDLSKWGMAQAVTRFSQDVEDYDRADELERIGGDVIELPTTAWKTIATAKAA